MVKRKAKKRKRKQSVKAGSAGKKDVKREPKIIRTPRIVPKNGEEPMPSRSLPVHVKSNEFVDLVKDLAGGVEVVPEKFHQKAMELEAQGHSVEAVANEALCYRLRLGMIKWMENLGILQRRLDDEQILQNQDLDAKDVVNMMSQILTSFLKMMEFLDKRTTDEAKLSAKGLKLPSVSEAPPSETIRKVRAMPSVKRDKLMAIATEIYNKLMQQKGGRNG